MKQPNIKIAVYNKTIAAMTVFIITHIIIHPVYAQAQNLTTAQTALNKFQGELNNIIPIAAALILLCLAIGYAGRYIEKDTFIRWAIGVIIAGSATQIANMLFSS
ncbi:VirB2 family type IV secretion system major pilin TrwL [Bartonella quintana]|uniref:VirB2 family type IV secretion system major pilin TrwL n=1 Tax=Bartonella quintana TaxID=803 RepID=UPI000DA2C386|nr:VirB2 family type IV secretion system major pilin TrwL [Bartonella quintana]SQF96736.1 TrbC/VIRB2 family [Bartonella quintana]